MRTLFLDLASHAGCIALVSEGSVVASLDVDHRISDGELMPFLATILETAAWKSRDVERIACVIGPGGFTSLRVAAAFTNALAYALDVPVAGIHLSDLYAVLTSLPSPSLEKGERGGEGIFWLHSTKKHELFVRGFGKAAKEYPEAALFPLEDFLSKVPSGFRWMGEMIPDHEKAVTQRSGEPVELRPLEAVLPEFVDALEYAKKTLTPWYGRKW